MSKGFYLLVALALAILCSCSAAFAVVYPTVEYIGYDPVTYTYTYKVTQPANEECIYAFDSFEIDGMMPLGTPYEMYGPFVGGLDGENLNWATRTCTYPPELSKMGYEWWADDSEKQVWPGMFLEEDWVGYFILRVPDSQPMPNGDAVTRQLGDIESEHSNLGFMAPNPIPEPTSFAVLAAMGGFLIPAVLRKRR